MYIIRYGGKNNKVIWKLSNYLRYFPKKKIIFFKNFEGAQAPLGHQVAPPLAKGRCRSHEFALSHLWEKRLPPLPYKHWPLYQSYVVLHMIGLCAFLVYLFFIWFHNIFNNYHAIYFMLDKSLTWLGREIHYGSMQRIWKMVVFYVSFVKKSFLGVFQGLNHICLGLEAVILKFVYKYL